MTRRILAVSAFLAILAVPAFAQQDLDAPQDYIANTLTFLLQNPPQPVNPNQVSIQLLDNPGPAPYCYWIVSRFLIGNSQPSGPVCTDKGPNTLVNGNQVTWSPVTGANVTFDVLRTSNQTPPSGACNCAIATNVNGLQATDTGLNAYTVNSFIPNTMNMVFDNEQASAGKAKLVSRFGGITVFTLNSDGSQVLGGSATAPAFISSSANPASTGAFRAATGDQVCFRNNANTGDVCISKSALDVLNLGTAAGVSVSSIDGFLYVDGTNLTTPQAAITALP